MFKKVVTHKNFWKSVLYLSVPFMVIFFLLNWGFTGFELTYFDTILRRVLALFVGGLIYGFTMTYIKFWTKLKEKEQKSK
jgi:hypothetical protein